MLTLQFDGLFRAVSDTGDSGAGHSNAGAGLMSYGWLIFRDGAPLARGHGVVARGRDATCNVAEYLALIEGLEALADLGPRWPDETVTVCGDAKVVIDQMRGEASVNALTMQPLHRQARRLAQRFEPVDWVWRPRRENRAADLLTRRALKQARADGPGYQAAMEALTRPAHRKARSRKLLTLLDLRVYGLGAEG